MSSHSVCVLLATALLASAAPVVAPADALSGADFFNTDRVIAKAAPEYRPHAGVGCELPAAALTLDKAIDLALCRNPSTRAAWAAAQVQAASLGVAEGAYLPSIGINAAGNELTGDLYPGAPRSGTQDSRNAVATLSWTLLDFNARRSAEANARNLVLAAAHIGSATAQRTVADVIQGYFSVVATEQAVTANLQTEANAAKSLEIARALQSGGAATLADVMQADTAYQQAIYTRIQSTNTAKASRANLAVLLGFSADQALALAAVAAPSAPALTARVGELLTQAARQRPDLAAARDQRAAAEAAVTSARAVGRAKVTFGVQHTLNQQHGLAEQNTNTVGLSVVLPLFSGLQTHYGIRRAEATLDEVAAQEEQSRLAVSLDVWNAYHALDAGNQELATSATLAKAAATNEEIAIGRYQSGVGSMLDVLTAQSAGANARVIRIQSEYNWQSARAQLALAVGRLSSVADLDAVAPSSAP